MKLTDKAIAALHESCHTLQKRTIPAENCSHYAVDFFRESKKVFEQDGPTIVSITFRIYIDEPVSKKGFARIYNDGTMAMWTGDDPFSNPY